MILEYAKFCGVSCYRGSRESRAIVPSCLRFVGPKFFHVGSSWVQNIFLWVIRGYQIFSREYLVVPKIFTRGYFVGPTFFIVGISWLKTFFSKVFCGSKILLHSINFSKNKNKQMVEEF